MKKIGQVDMHMRVYRCFLEVRNTATGAQATAQVVDECQNGGLDLDAAVFSEIDTDGAVQPAATSSSTMSSNSSYIKDGCYIFFYYIQI
jgi:hypothetical protein